MANKSCYDERARRHTYTSSNAKTAGIDVGRVFDSCSDRDCVEDLRVYFSACDQDKIERASSVRAKKAKVLGTCIDVDELPFRDGYYTCKLTFFIEVQVEAVVCDQCQILRGCTVLEKQVALYGGDGASVQVFSGELRRTCGDPCADVMSSSNTPRCVVQVAEPVLLDVQVRDVQYCHKMCSCCCEAIPQVITSCFEECLVPSGDAKVLSATIGLFTIVQLVRNTQLMIPVYEYHVPCKECHCDEDTPCELFRKMSFPVDAFFPPLCMDSGK